MNEALGEAAAALPDGWEIDGPTWTATGWRASARPRQLWKRMSGRAYGYGVSPEEALRNLAAALREEDGDEDPDDLSDGRLATPMS